MKISEKIKFRNTCDESYEFYDIDLDNDTKLFLEPGLIMTSHDPLSRKAADIISNYFDKLFESYRDVNDISNRAYLLEHCREVNFTKLGYGNGNNGKGKTATGLLDTFHQMELLFGNGINMSSPSDLAILLPRFAEDCLSDMLTNILLNELSSFTWKQCQKYGISDAYFSAPQNPLYYWDTTLGGWMGTTAPQLTIDNHIILLVPRRWLLPRIYCNTRHFIRHMVIEKLRQDGSFIKSNGRISFPLVKNLEQELKAKYGSPLDIATHFAKRDHNLLSKYHNNFSAYYAGRGLPAA